MSFQGKEYVIWSGQWAAWWRPDDAGYTTDLLQAGLYRKDDAESRRAGCGPEKKIAIQHWTEAWTDMATNITRGSLGESLEMSDYPSPPSVITDMQAKEHARMVRKLAEDIPDACDGDSVYCALEELAQAIEKDGQ